MKSVMLAPSTFHSTQNIDRKADVLAAPQQIHTQAKRIISSDELQIIQMEMCDKDDVHEIMVKAFSDEPINVRLATTPERDAKWVGNVLPHCVNGLSQVAFYKRRLVGAVLCIDEEVLNAIPLDEFAGSPDYGIQMDLFDELHSMANIDMKKKTAHLWMAVCDPTVRNMGILLHLGASFVLACVNQGYEQVITEASGKYSQAEARKNGFETKAKIYYDQWTWKGTKPLALRPDIKYRADTSMHDAVELMAMDCDFASIKRKLEALVLAKL